VVGRTNAHRYRPRLPCCATCPLHELVWRASPLPTGRTCCRRAGAGYHARQRTTLKRGAVGRLACRCTPCAHHFFTPPPLPPTTQQTTVGSQDLPLHRRHTHTHCPTRWWRAPASQHHLPFITFHGLARQRIYTHAVLPLPSPHTPTPPPPPPPPHPQPPTHHY